MALTVSEISYEHREILLRNKPASMLAASPKATVPVFIKSDGRVIDESEDIMLWALAKNDPMDWLLKDQDGTAAQLDLMHQITGDFKPHLDRYKYASRYRADKSRGSVDLAHRDKACAILAPFEDILSTQAYLTGDAPRLADYGTFAFIRQFANVEPQWWNAPVLPHVHRWLDGLVNSDLFQEIMQKHELWVEPPV